MFIQLCQILAELGGAGVAIVTIRKDIDQRIAAGTLKLEDPFPPEHLATVQHRVHYGIDDSDSLWSETHAGEGG